jgi:hypothetical protein
MNISTICYTLNKTKQARNNMLLDSILTRGIVCLVFLNLNRSLKDMTAVPGKIGFKGTMSRESSINPSYGHNSQIEAVSKIVLISMKTEFFGKEFSSEL